MKLFILSQDKLSLLTERKFKRELDIQKVTENNLEKIFGLEYLTSEMSLNNLRIDTLAFNRELNAFVIIEYKKDRNFSLIDQGYAYLSLLLNNKADFVLEYNKSRNESWDKKSIDWSQSRVIFISPMYTRYQIQAANFRDLPFELWEIHQFDRNVVIYNQIRPSDKSESIKVIGQGSELVREITREIEVYTEEDHVTSVPGYIRDLYEEFKENVLGFGDDIEIKALKQYVAFKTKNNFVSVIFQKSQLKLILTIPLGSLNDPLGLARDVSNIGHWASGDYEIILKPNSNMTDILLLVRQSYEMKKS